ncbi:MAG: DUF397 domain-containing protein [Pseudonocardiaceae bacterium]
MNTTDLMGATWRKSSRSNAQASCVEVTELGGGRRAVRDSKNPSGPALICTPAEWAAFTAGIRTGKFG